MSRFDDVLKVTLGFEGGYSNNPNDKGGGTVIADAVGANNGTLNGGSWVDPTDITWWDESV